MPNEQKAGGELDRLIAEKVMGWQWLDHEHDPILVPPAAARGTHVIPEYSADIASAWEVVVELKRLGFRYFLGNGVDKPHSCYFEDPGTRQGEAESDTAPHAICLAALKAVAALPAKQEASV